MNLVKQERARRTRQAILLAAAAVFDERGYQAASIAEILTRMDMTKGALYFHFASKEELARAVIGAQLSQVPLREHELLLQSVIDLSLDVARELQENVLLRAGIRLTIEQGSFQAADPGPYRGWIDLSERLLVAAMEHGELLEHVDPAGVAELAIGCFSGVQVLSQVMTDRKDLVERIGFFWIMLLPGLAKPDVIGRLRTVPECDR